MPTFDALRCRMNAAVRDAKLSARAITIRFKDAKLTDPERRAYQKALELLAALERI